MQTLSSTLSVPALDPCTLMMNASSLVDVASRSMRARGTPCSSRDLRAFGMRGLWEAALRYEPSRGVPFAAYAAKRVRGAMVDTLRSEGALPRRKPQAANDVVQDMQVWATDATEAEVPCAQAPDEILERAELLRLVDDALASMPREQADVVRRHFFEDERLSDIAQAHGRSRSWGSRQLDLAMNSLRRHVRAAA